MNFGGIYKIILVTQLNRESLLLDQFAIKDLSPRGFSLRPLFLLHCVDSGRHSAAMPMPPTQPPRRRAPPTSCAVRGQGGHRAPAFPSHCPALLSLSPFSTEPPWLPSTRSSPGAAPHRSKTAEPSASPSSTHWSKGSSRSRPQRRHPCLLRLRPARLRRAPRRLRPLGGKPMPPSSPPRAPLHPRRRLRAESLPIDGIVAVLPPRVTAAEHHCRRSRAPRPYPACPPRSW